MCIVYTNNTLSTTAACDKSEIVNNVLCRRSEQNDLINPHQYIQCNFES